MLNMVLIIMKTLNESMQKAIYKIYYNKLSYNENSLINMKFILIKLCLNLITLYNTLKSHIKYNEKPYS